MSNLEARAARLEAIVDTAMRLLASQSGTVELALIELDKAAETAKRVEADGRP
jgi:hypothetical protein